MSPKPSELFRPGGKISSTTTQDKDRQDEEHKLGHREIKFWGAFSLLCGRLWLMTQLFTLFNK